MGWHASAYEGKGIRTAGYRPPATLNCMRTEPRERLETKEEILSHDGLFGVERDSWMNYLECPESE